MATLASSAGRAGMFCSVVLCCTVFLPLSCSSAYLARWLDLSAAKRVISDLPGYCNAMQEHTDRSKTKVVMIPVAPPAKSSLPKKALDVDWLRSFSMGITTICLVIQTCGPQPHDLSAPLGRGTCRCDEAAEMGGPP